MAKVRSPSLCVVAVAMAVTAFGVVLCQTPTSTCTNTIASLSPCIAFLTAGNAKTPTTDCCSAVAESAGNTGGCLCQLLGTNYPLGFPINETRVLILPGTCNVVNIPSLDQCTNAGAPFTPLLDSPPPTDSNSPSGSPAPSPSAVSIGNPSVAIPRFTHSLIALLVAGLFLLLIIF